MNTPMAHVLMAAVFVPMVLVASFVHQASADEVYLSRGAYGEASFADFALADAVPVQVAVHQPSVFQADAVRYRTGQIIAIAAELEDARMAREKRYAEARERATRRATPRVAEQPREEYRRIVSFGYPRRHHMRAHVVPRTEPELPPPLRKPLRWTGRSGQL